MLGGYISDLEAGDEFRPVEYVLTPFIASEYAHGVEESWESFHSARGPWQRQVRPPTAVYTDKIRILDENCPRERRVHGERGPNARIHAEFHARQHSPAFVGERLVVSGRVTNRYVKRALQYIEYQLEVHTSDGRLVQTYWDKTVLKFEREAGTPGE